MDRIATIKRKTNETNIDVTLNLDGKGKSSIDTGIGFFDHMLSAFSRHGLFDLDVKCTGDLNVDCHHTIEDTGIVIGQAIREALGSKAGIRRYGSSVLPMDETLIMCAVDLCDRPYLVFDETFNVPSVGGFDTEMTKEFFYALSYSAMMNLHLREISGENAHHIIEASFKAFSKALMEAVSIDERISGVLSTKGAL
jgi:imidazoleglycerol-phosphate dehydratase